MNWFTKKRKSKGERLKAQATHTDDFGALYKYVNGRLFHFRRHPCWDDICVWGIINLPKDHKIYKR
ncbi:hypothetical protein P19_0105 [Aeromonas phage P19]|uniref:Uncharacterized protein n=1 Tax=Aeromonas phage AS-szw TaxID=2026114 RepID=A0A291LDR7_9CAUD|nr:hypothetical protein [Aeromonas phage AS-szw]UKM62593.1 hypothetical protein P19_0105 [Aeromonas phage P19]